MRNLIQISASFPAVLLAGLTLLISPAGSIAATAGKRAPASVVSSNSGAVVFRVDLEPWSVIPSPALTGTDRVRVPGFINKGLPGAPAVPARKFLVGLPAEGSWTVSSRALRSTSLGTLRIEPSPLLEARNGGDLGPVPAERYVIDPEIYDTWLPSPAVHADDPAWIRRQRVLPVWVEPLQYDPATGETVLLTSIEITVRFSGPGGNRPQTGSDRSGLNAESAEWEDTFSKLLVNAPQAHRWRRPRRERDISIDRSYAPQQSGPAIKLKVKKTGAYKLSAETAIAAGFPSGRPVGELHFFKRDYDEAGFAGTVKDIGFRISENPAGTPGVFDGQDLLVFYALRLRDDPSREEPAELCSDHNVYWLGTTSGPMMPDRSMTPGTLSPDTASAWFQKTEMFTDDRFFRENTPQGRTDYYFFNTGILRTVDFPFEMGAIRPGSSVSLTAQLHGAFRGQIRSVTTHLLNSTVDRILTPTVFTSNISVQDYQVAIPAADLDVGTNTFRFYRQDDPGNFVNTHLNWLEVTYAALYRAHGNQLAFDTGTQTGITDLTVTGLSDTDLWLFDVTDPESPVNCVLSPGLFTDVGDSYALTFREDVSSKQSYVLTDENHLIEIPPVDVELDDNSAIIGDAAESGVDVLVISHGDFKVLMGDWVRYRRAQGYRVLLVDVEDVYDEFNGGVPGTRGIDRFIRHFFELGNAGYVLLVGDGSEDHKHTSVDSGPDFIPSHTRTEYIQPPWNTDEVVTLDKEFVKLPGPGGTVDQYPDLVVGRMPVGTGSELQIVLNKIFGYEQPDASDFWRRRMIIVADDGWSGDNQNSCYASSEVWFESGQDSTAMIIERSYPGMFDVIKFYLSDFTRTLHSAPTDPPQNNYCEPQMNAIRTNIRTYVTPQLLDELGQGATLVTIQSHMNRSLVTHEMLFTTSRAVAGGGVGKDHQRINNRDKPFVVFGMGCHFSDYALERELRETYNNSPNGDAFAEQLLFQNREGAVSTYGSSGFEYLGQVNQFMYIMAGVWFYDAPYDNMINQTEGRWMLGQLMFLTETAATDRGQTLPVSRYHILGDPLLRIEAGPPLMDVTVNGETVQSGDNVISDSDTIAVRATVRDENVIEKFELVIDGVDKSQTLDIRPIGDESIAGSRNYEVSFLHTLQVKAYDIVLRALQAPDTTAGQYHMAAEFVLHVPSLLELSVNGRIISDGDMVPSSGNYSIDLSFPVFVPSSQIGVRIDDEDVTGLVFGHPSAGDTTSWVVQFSKKLPVGSHELIVSVGATDLSPVRLIVGNDAGLRDVINYPNPFEQTTQFVYTIDVELESGTIDVFTTSGRKIRRLEIPPDARTPGQNAVFWDGRDSAGDEIANGVYLYVIRVTQRGQTSSVNGKLVRMR